MTAVYIPNNVLIIEHTEDLETELSRQDQATAGILRPTLDFTTMWGDGARWFVRPSEDFMDRTGRQFRNKYEKYFEEGDNRDTNCRRAKIGTYTDLPGQYHINAQVGVGALDITTDIEGVIGFPGYIHSIKGDINIVIPQSSGLRVFPYARDEVRRNGKLVPNAQVPKFEQYFSKKPSAEMQRFMQEHFDVNYTWLNFLDGIRTRSKLYIRADSGSININSPRLLKDVAGNNNP